MPRLLHVLPPLLLLALPAAAHPWKDLVSELRAEGILSHEVNWNEVNSLCLGLLGEPERYNECRLRHAVTQVRHSQDRNVCERKTGPATYRQRHVYRYDPDPPVFNDRLAAHHYYRHLHQRLHRQQRQRDALEQCMEDRGWADGRNWRAGML